MPEQEETDAAPGPSTVDQSEKRGGLDPEEFQRELIFVTATVLILGIVGGSCLGMKIQRAEKMQNQRAQQQEQTTPQHATPRGASGSESGGNALE